ncbi:hypothetical protein D3C86_1924440 [compost metagenome]
MSQQREPSLQEIETLKSALIARLPSEADQDLTAIAVLTAKAVKAAFDELYSITASEAASRCS